MFLSIFYPGCTFRLCPLGNKLFLTPTPHPTLSLFVCVCVYVFVCWNTLRIKDLLVFACLEGIPTKYLEGMQQNARLLGLVTRVSRSLSLSPISYPLSFV